MVGEKVFISISGLIGAGKSTLAKALGRQLGLPVFEEPVTDNKYLADFYKDIPKYAFPMQIYLLNERFKQQQMIIWNGKGGVQDRSIYEDSIFAKMLRDSGMMDDRDYQTYKSLFMNMSNFMKKPNIIVHLDVSPEESMRRIKMRNRGIESGISLEYLKNLHAGYEEFIKEISRVIPVIKVNYETFRTSEEMAAAIAEQYKEITNIRYVSFDKPILATPSKDKDACAAASAAAVAAGGGSTEAAGARLECKEAAPAPGSPMEIATPPATPLKSGPGSPASPVVAAAGEPAAKRQLVLESA